MRKVGDLMSTRLTVLSPRQTLLEAALTLDRAGVGGAPVVDDSERAVGMLTLWDLNALVLRESKTALHKTLAQVMTPVVLSLGPASDLMLALRLLADARVHRVTVVDAEQRPLGVLTSMDLLKALRANHQPGSSGFDIVGHELRPILNELIARSVRVAMSRPLHCAEPSQTVANFLRLCQNRWFSGAPVVDKGMMVGLVSQADVARFLRYADGDLEHCKIGEIMTPFSFVLGPAERLEAALDMLVERDIHRVVVVDGKRRPLGVITPLDVLRLVLRRAGGRTAA